MSADLELNRRVCRVLDLEVDQYEEPNWSGDLNLVYELEELLGYWEQFKYMNILNDPEYHDDPWERVHATAETKVRAWLRVKEAKQ